MGGLTVGRRLGLAFGFMLIVVLSVAGTGYWGVQTVSRLARAIVTVDVSMLGASKQAHISILELRRSEKDCFLNVGNADKFASYLARWNAVNEQLKLLLQELGADRADVIDRNKVLTMQRHLALYEEGFRSVIGHIRNGTVKTPAEGNDAIAKYKDEIRILESATEDLAASCARHMADRAVAIEGSTNQVTTTLLLLVVVAIALCAVISTIVTRAVTVPIADLSSATKRLASGDLTGDVAATTRSDEVGQLVNAFRSMWSGIREIVVGLRDGVRSITASSAQLSATAKEYADMLSQQATSVAEVTATVEEIKQTSQAAAMGARDVAQGADAAMESGRRGRNAAADAVTTMQSVGERVCGIATQILKLSEQTTQIGMIVETVNELAEQSNLLAVNASIEAAKAGDHGRGFAVVASEVRSLAEQSKRATQQIRGILADIQKATHGAVMATEEGTKRTEDGQRAIEGVRGVIEELAAVLEQSSTRARQIAGAASQQAAGVTQISTAMAGIAKAQRDSANGVKQLEAAVVDLNRFATKLDTMAAAYKV